MKLQASVILSTYCPQFLLNYPYVKKGHPVLMNVCNQSWYYLRIGEADGRKTTVEGMFKSRVHSVPLESSTT
jgi:hypothetical protein